MTLGKRAIGQRPRASSGRSVIGWSGRRVWRGSRAACGGGGRRKDWRRVPIAGTAGTSPTPSSPPSVFDVFTPVLLMDIFRGVTHLDGTLFYTTLF